MQWPITKVRNHLDPSLTSSFFAAEAELLGLRHRNETTPGTLDKVSMVGGLQFFIDGKGMDDLPQINVPKFIPTQGDLTSMSGPPLNSK